MHHRVHTLVSSVVLVPHHNKFHVKFNIGVMLDMDKDKHAPPYGRYCKLVKKTGMAESGDSVPNRDDPRYIDYLENQL